MKGKYQPRKSGKRPARKAAVVKKSLKQPPRPKQVTVEPSKENSPLITFGLWKHKALWVAAVLLFVVITLITNKSGFGLTFTRHNNEIDPEERKAIQKLNQSILDGLCNKDFSVFKKNASKEVDKEFDEDQVSKIYWQIKWFFDLKPGFDVFNEYKVSTLKIGTFQTLIPSQTDPAFTHQVILYEPEAYVSMLLSKEVRSQKMLVVFSYEKENGDWKLYRVHMGVQEINGLDAPGWAKKYQELHDQGMVGASAMGLQLLDLCGKPDPIFQYVDEPKWRQLFDDAKKEMDEKYHFPLLMNEIPGKPVVYSMNVALGPLGPMVYVKYQTGFKLDQRKQIEAEARAMVKPLEVRFPGVEKVVNGFDFLAYENSPSDPNGYGTIVNLK